MTRTFYHAISTILYLFFLCAFSQTAIAAKETLAKEYDLTTINGVISYKQRIALPTNSVIQLEIKEISSKKVVENAKIALQGEQVPIPFSITLNRDLLKRNKSYQLQATILVNKKATWRTDAIVINKQSANQDVGILLANPTNRK